jgi:glycosyltransferase involved in cell wall biosynthesis
MSEGLPQVSLIILCRNEETFIRRCLDSVIANEYPKDKLEVLVVDGMSSDKTREIIREYEHRYSYIRMINNYKKFIPFAYNEGIKHSSGELVMIMSAHAFYADDYIRKCVEASLKYDVDNVVGSWRILPRRKSLMAKALVTVLSSPFGVGNARYRTRSNAKKNVEYVDTGAYGCYKRNVFEKIGLYNENLIRGEDMEFNLRLKRAGGKTLLIPDAVVFYFARTGLKSFCRHNFKNGLWALLPFKYASGVPVSWRHLVPLFFVGSLIILMVLSLFSNIYFWFFLSIVVLYLLLGISFSLKTAIQEKQWKDVFILPVAFGTLHISYGLGSLVGLLNVIFSTRFWEKRRVR